MARQTVYEGPDLQQLLQKVIDERGPARIRPPERRRKGGLFGFFAHEVYVITVDESETASASDESIFTTAEGSLAAVAGSTESPTKIASVPTDVAQVATSGATMTRAASRAAHAANRSAARVSAYAPRRDMVTTPLSALIESTEDEAELTTALTASRASRFGHGATNGSLGGRLADNGVQHDDSLGTGYGPYGGLGGDVARGDVRTAPRPAPVPPPAPAPATPKPFRDVLSEIASSLGEEPGTYRPDPEKLHRPQPPAARPLAATDLSHVPARDPRDERVKPGAPAVQLPLAGLDGQLPLAGLDAPAAQAAAVQAGRNGSAESERAEGLSPEAHATSVAVHEAYQVHEARQVHEGDDVHEANALDLDATIVDLLRDAGFPDELLPRTALDPALPTLEAVFSTLPTPPPLPADPGGLVAVVGSTGLVRPIANEVAFAVGCPEDEVAIASPTASDRHAPAERRARTAAQASALSGGWRRDKVAVVAVNAPPMGTDQCWTREVLRALRPSCVWGMADATTKPDDVRRWVSAIGGVDALVLTGVPATGTPASILSLGIPVACLDDEPATPERWAAVVADLVTKR